MSGNIIVYPISLSYIPDWTAWNVISELCSNAMDSDPGFKMGLTPETDSTGPELWISGRGNLVEKHLLLGVSEKSSKDGIGQHGEGLKLAMLVLTRLGLTAHIHTDNLYLWNEAAKINDTDVFAIAWNNDVPESHEQGFTHIVIPDWPHRLYKNRFVIEGDPRVVYVDPFGRMVLDEEVPQLYVKGVWVSPAKGYGKPYRFGYNLTDIKMNRDRATVSQWDVNWEIGKIWASCTDEDLLERFWQSVYDGGSERDCRLANHDLAKGPHKRAFKTVFGPHTVVGTSETTIREAEYIGANVITEKDIGHSLVDSVTEIIGTDTEHIQALNGQSKVFVPDKKLGDIELKVLKLLRRLARRVGFQGKILAYILPKNVQGEQHKDNVRISLGRLDSDKTAVATWLHEEAHRAAGTADATAEMVDQVTAIAANLIVSYARR